MKRFPIPMLCLLLCLLLCLPMGSLAEGSFEEIAPEEGLTGGRDQLLSALGESLQTAPSLVVTGELVWHFAGDSICCTDGNTGALLSSLPVEKVCGRTDAEYLWLAARGEGLWLCTAFTEPEQRILFYPLSKEGEGLSAGTPTDATEELAFLLEDGYLELDLIGCGSRLCFCALREDLVFDLILFDPQTKSLKGLPEQPLILCDALIPYGEDILLAGISTQVDQAIDLKLLDTESGESELFCTLITGSTEKALNYAVDAAQNKLFFTLGQNACRAELLAEESAAVFAVLPEAPADNRLGALCCGNYFLLTEGEELLHTDGSAVLTSQRLILADYAATEGLPDFLTGYHQRHPELFFELSVGGEESDVTDAMVTASQEPAIAILSLSGNVYKALSSRGYLTELSSSGLREAVSDMSEAVQRLAFADGKLLALPLESEAACMGLNGKGFCELCGCTEEELPTDWTGFLTLLASLAEGGELAESETWRLSENHETAEDFRSLIFSRILQDAFLYLEQEDAKPEELQTLLPPILTAFEAVDWTMLGLQEEAEEDLSWLGEEERIPLITELNPVIETHSMEEGCEYWPLSLAEGGERLIPQTVRALIINPYAPMQAELQAFAEELWQNWPVISRMSLCGSLNEPVKNECYGEDIAAMESMVPVYQSSILVADAMEARVLQAELDDLLAFLEEYKQNAYWSASEESIAEYRSISRLFLPAPDEFWSADEGDDAVLQYLGGMITAQQLTEQLVSTLKMNRLEGY